MEDTTIQLAQMGDQLAFQQLIEAYNAVALLAPLFLPTPNPIQPIWAIPRLIRQEIFNSMI